MAGVLVVAEARRGELREVSLELITAAAAVRDAAGGRVAVALIDADARVARGGAGGGWRRRGARWSRSPVANFEAHVAARALEELIEAEQPALVLVGHTIDSMGFAPAVAARGRPRFRQRRRRARRGMAVRSPVAAPTATSSSTSWSSRARSARC